jgi:hypothetical protein
MQQSNSSQGRTADNDTASKKDSTSDGLCTLIPILHNLVDLIEESGLVLLTSGSIAENSEFNDA